jgi:hypothetical protein
MQWDFLIEWDKRFSDRLDELFEDPGVSNERSVLRVAVRKTASYREFRLKAGTKRRRTVVKDSSLSARPLSFFPLRATCFNAFIAPFTASMTKLGGDSEVKVTGSDAVGDLVIMDGGKEVI